MKYGVYCIKNTLSGSSDGLFLFLSDGHASVELAGRFKKVYALKEFELYKVGTFDVLSRKIEPCDEVFISWDTRRLESEMIKENVE